MITRRQQEFIRYYVERPNATEAARKAGYSNKHGADSYAAKLMKNPEISGRIKALLDEKYDINREQYIKQTLNLHSKESNSNVKARYWELIGNVKGFTKEKDIHLTVNNIGEDTLNSIHNKRLKKDKPKLPIDSQTQGDINT